MATSVPVPIAMPRSACASAGASFTPSPTMATTSPLACKRRTSAALSPGSTPDDDAVDADLGGHGPGLGAAVAGDQYRRQAERAELVDRRAAGRLDRVGDDELARGRAVPRAHRGGRASPRRISTARPSTVPPGPPTPGVGVPERSRRVRQLRPSRRRGERGDRAARPGARSRPRRRRRAAAARSRPSRRRRHLAGGSSCPVVTVPVLSSTTRVDPAGLLEHLRAPDQHARAARRGRCRPAAPSAWPGRARTGRR